MFDALPNRRDSISVPTQDVPYMEHEVNTQMEPTVEMTTNNKKPATKAPEPGFRKALRRAVACCGSMGKLAKASKGKLNKTQINHLLHDTPAITTRWAIAIEKATGGAINRVEFYPELFRDNPQAREAIREMVRSPARAIRDGESSGESRPR